MNNTDNHISTWSMTDVQRYLRGELPPAEMHRLEKLALDDPFLADALEGLQNHAPVDEHIAELRNRLETRVTSEKKPIRLPRLKIAAAIILLLGVGFTAWYTLFDQTAKQKAPIANRERFAADTIQTVTDSSRLTASQPAAKIPADTLPATAFTAPALANAKPHTHTTARTLPAAAAPDNEVASSYSRAAGVKTEEKRPPANLDQEKDTQLRPTETRTDTAAMAKNSVKMDTVLYNTNSGWVSPAVASSSKPFGNDKLQSVRIRGNLNTSSSANLLAFSGRVLDFKNHPVAGATLFFSNNNITRTGTITDHDGYFNLYLPVADTTRHLTVAMTGYEDAQYALNSDDRSGNTIFLKENAARLDEVVVTGLGAKRKETLAAPPSDEPEVLDSFWLKTVPVMGRIAYLNYIERAGKNLAVDTTVHGIESISFLVDQKGTISQFKIERSLSPAHDAGLIHLIQEGPPWKMVHGKKARALVSVTFP